MNTNYKLEKKEMFNGISFFCEFLYPIRQICIIFVNPKIKQQEYL